MEIYTKFTSVNTLKTITYDPFNHHCSRIIDSNIIQLNKVKTNTMKNSLTTNNIILLLLGLTIGVILFVLVKAVAFLIPLILLYVIYKVFLSKYITHYKI